MELAMAENKGSGELGKIGKRLAFVIIIFLAIYGLQRLYVSLYGDETTNQNVSTSSVATNRNTASASASNGASSNANTSGNTQKTNTNVSTNTNTTSSTSSTSTTTNVSQPKATSSRSTIDEEVAMTAFEYRGEREYPYGFKCHWIMNTLAHDQQSDGSWSLKVGVTITNQYGASYDTTAEAVIGGTNDSPQVTYFYVY